MSADLELLGKPESLIEFVVDRPAHDRRYRVDASKLLALGWQPKWRFWDGLEATVNWYPEQPEWWRAIKVRRTPPGLLRRRTTGTDRSSARARG